MALVLALMLGLLVTAGCSPSGPVGGNPSSEPDPSTGPTSALSPEEDEIGFGVFQSTDEAAVAAFGDWADREVGYAVDFSARDTWQQVASPRYLTDEWEGTPYRLVLGVALLPREEEASLAVGATGAYDEYYVELAELLVDTGLEDTIIRLGWEFNIDGSAWRPDDPEVFIAYWRSVVDAMRSVPGQELEFDWNVNNGPNPVDGSLYFPGAEWVDYIGVDAYDVSSRVYPYPDDCGPECRQELQDEAWDRTIYGHERGLMFWAQFARDRGMPMSVPEWGLWDRPDGIGGGENPSFVRRMHEFIHDEENNVAYHAYFEYDSDETGQHSLQVSFPESGELFRELFVP